MNATYRPPYPDKPTAKVTICQQATSRRVRSAFGGGFGPQSRASVFARRPCRVSSHDISDDRESSKQASGDARPTEAAGIAAVFRRHPFRPCGCLSWRNHPALARAGGNWLCFARGPVRRGNRNPKRDMSRLGTRPCGCPPGMGRHGGLPLRCLTGTLPARPAKIGFVFAHA